MSVKQQNIGCTVEASENVIGVQRRPGYEILWRHLRRSKQARLLRRIWETNIYNN